jgi:hypothetical protein
MVHKYIRAKAHRAAGSHNPGMNAGVSEVVIMKSDPGEKDITNPWTDTD